MVRIDMSEHGGEVQRPASDRRPPGYVVMTRAASSSEAVRCRPYCVILLDDREGNPDVFNILLQVPMTAV